MSDKLIIDEEFKALLPPHTKEEREELRQRIIEEGGARDAITTWNGIIVDGMTRYDICHHEGLGYTVKPKSFQDRTEASRWIRRNALSRRNLTDFAKAEIALGLKTEIESEIKAKEVARKQGNMTRQNSDESSRTDERVAQEAGVSRDTIRKVEVVKSRATPAVVNAARSGVISTNKAHEISKLPKKDQPTALKNANTHRPRRATLGNGQDKGKLIREVKSLIGQVVRLLDKRGKDGHHAKCNKAINDFLEAWETWT